MNAAQVAGVAGLIALSVAACGDSGPASYYPVDTNHVWKYRAYVGRGDGQRPVVLTVSMLPPRDFLGVTVYPRKYDIDLGNGPTATAFEYYRADGSAVCMRGEQKPGASAASDYQDTRCILEFPLKEGFSWRQSGDRDLTKGQEVGVSTRVETMDDTVTVPAGTYSHCVKIIASADQSIAYPAMFGSVPANFHFYEEDWYASGVGLVKSTQLTTITGNMMVAPEDQQRTTSMELAEFK